MNTKFCSFAVAAATLMLSSMMALLPSHADQEQDLPSVVLINNVNVWDGTSDSVIQGTDVLVVGNKVEKIGKGIQPTYTFTMEDKEGNKAEKSVQAHVVDGQGGTVTPGLIDMHQHLNLNGGTSAGTYDWDAYVVGAHASRAAEYLLRNGFTTIRDIAGNSLSLKRAVNSGQLPGPRIYSSGPAIGPTGGHSDWGSYNDGPGQSNYQIKVQNTHVVDGVDAWLQAARWNFRNGGDYLKVMSGGGVASVYDPLDLNSPSLDEMKAAVQVANEYSSYVAIHGYTDAAYNKSMDAGVKSFEHGFLITEETVKRMKEEDVWWSFQPFGAYTTLCGAYPDWYSAGMKEKAATVCIGVKNAIGLIKKYGIKTFVGSDMFGWDNWHNALVNVATPTTDLPDELKYTSVESMKMSTSYAGQALRELSAPSRDPFKKAKLGVVEEGAWADILIWKGDPTQDISLILEEQNLLFIMKDGVSYKNLLVDPTHESFRDGLKPSGFSWSM